MATSTERMARRRQRLQEQHGMTEIRAWVHPSQFADVKLMLQRLAENPDLTVGSLRDLVTHRFVRLRP